MNYHFRVHREKRGGYWAQCVELPGCVTEADDKKKLAANMSEALELFLSEPEHSQQIFAEPKSSVAGKNIARVRVEPHVALAMRVRQARVRMKLSQAEMAKRLGFEHVSAYQKLEKPTSNPTLKTLQRLRKVLPDLSLDDLLAA